MDEVKELGQVWVGFETLSSAVGNAMASIETVIWGDARAKHTYVVVQPAASDTSTGPVWRRLEILRVGGGAQVTTIELTSAPSESDALLRAGWTTMTLAELIEVTDQLRENHSTYNAFGNNCRTFVDSLLPRVCNAGHIWPDGVASPLEWIHAEKKAKSRAKKRGV